MARKLAARLGQPVVVENRPGASGILGTKAVVDAAPDGYTLLMGTTGPVATNFALYKQLPYDLVNGLLPIASVMKASFVLAVPATLAVTKMSDLAIHVRAKLGKANFGSGSSTYQIINELFLRSAGLQATHVPYKGASQMVVDLAAGQLDFAITDFSVVVPLMKAGKLRVLAVTGDARLASEQEIPTLAESGYPVHIPGSWGGLFAPARTPMAIVRSLEKEIFAITSEPEFAALLSPFQWQPFFLTSKEFATFRFSEINAWVKAAELAGIQKE